MKSTGKEIGIWMLVSDLKDKIHPVCLELGVGLGEVAQVADALTAGHPGRVHVQQVLPGYLSVHIFRRLELKSRK
jgi:hypothetical protein